MKCTFLILSAILLVANIASADDMAVASVDVRKIFNEWQYSVETQEKMVSIRNTFERENNDRLAVINDYRLKRNRIQQQFDANKETMTDEDKKKMYDLYRSLQMDAVALEQDRKDFSEKKLTALANEVSSSARFILERITEAIQVYALEKKYDMVIETGGHTTRNTPLFVHLDSAVDITDDVIMRLNDSDDN